MSIIFPQFEECRNIKYGFSTRQDGSMNRHTQKGNREAYFRKIGIDPERVVTADLIHGAKVEKVGKESGGKMIQGADSLVANGKKLFVSATGADCFLLYFCDPVKQVAGIAHSGWRSLLSGVVKNTLEVMICDFGSSSRDILAGISPGIGKCHFEISPDDKIKYKNYPKFILERNEKIYIDLPGIAKLQLKQGGILEENIADSGICTYCDKENYFSFRRDKPKEIQPMIGYIGFIS